MSSFVDRIVGTQEPLLWVDDSAYSDRLLAGGKTPWCDAAAYVAFRRKAVGLLRPDFNVVPVGALVRGWVEANPGLREAIAARKRSTAPVRTLLAEAPLREHLAETVSGLRAAFANLPMALAIPSPRAWLRDAYRLAFGDGEEIDVGGDETDACAVYVADFLRSFGGSGIDAVLLEESAGAEPASEEEIAWYQPVINTAAHYRWDLGLHAPMAAAFTDMPTGVQFLITSKPSLTCPARGLVLDDTFWRAGAVPVAPAGGFLVAAIPADAAPELVLERLAALRG